MLKKIAFLAIGIALLAPYQLAAQSGVVINEIMYAPHSSEPEWIELFSADTSNFNIAQWQISTSTMSVTLPINSITADQNKQYIVITNDSIMLRAKRPGDYPIVQCALPALDSTGDEIVLKNTSPQTVDSLYYLPSWGGSTGASLERRNVLKASTDSTNWGTCIAPSGATPGVRNSIATPDTTPTVTAAHPLDIVINEIMVEVVSPEPQWIELLNTTPDTINIAGWTLTVKGHAPVVIPHTNTIIPPDSMQILSSNDTVLAQYRKIPIPRIVQLSLPHMDYGGSTLALRDAFGNLIDSVYYDGTWIKADGISLERIDPATVGYDSTNWGACVDSSGSTILRPNSDRIRDYDLALSSARLTDTSVTITIVNMGRDTIQHTAVALQIGTFDTIVQQVSILLPSHDSQVVQFPLPDNFYGLFPATAYLIDSLDKNPANDTLRFSVAPPIPPDSIVINEIMFGPKPTGCQWLELYNLSAKWISMDSVRLITGESRPGEYSHIIPQLVIPPDSFALITANDSIYTTYPSLVGRSGIASLSISSLDFGKDSCFVVLHNEDSTTIDSVHYFKTWQQSLLTKTFVGISLERKDPRGASNDPGNWQASLDTLGATPLAKNSVGVGNYDLALTTARLTDTTVIITMENVGSDTVRHTALALHIGTFDTIVQHVSTLLPSHDSLVVQFPLPDNFYGLFPATAYLIDSLDKNPANDTLRFSIAPPIPADSLVLNEIMFDPQPTGCEWLELYNLSNKWVSMDSTRLITGETRPGEYTHVIPPLVIAPDSFGLITANDSIYRTYPTLVGRSGIASLRISSLNLGKDSCFVVLHNLDLSTIDSVHYFKTWQQSMLKKTFAGISLERKDPRGESNDPSNWRASLEDSATPLAPNLGDTSSTPSTPPAGTVFAASFSPNPFSPDGDGFQDTSTLTVQTPSSAMGGNSTAWSMRVRIYDAHGRMVRLLTDAATILGSAKLPFNGKRDNGQTLPPGLYTVLIELTSQSPLQTLKQETGVVIAGKRR